MLIPELSEAICLHHPFLWVVWGHFRATQHAVRSFYSDCNAMSEDHRERVYSCKQVIPNDPVPAEVKGHFSSPLWPLGLGDLSVNSHWRSWDAARRRAESYSKKEPSQVHLGLLTVAAWLSTASKVCGGLHCLSLAERMESNNFMAC